MTSSQNSVPNIELGIPIEVIIEGYDVCFEDLFSVDAIPDIIPKLRETLNKDSTHPFVIRYCDDENDLVSIDSEDEEKEFCKLAKKRCSEGKSLRITVTTVLSTFEVNRIKHLLEYKGMAPGFNSLREIFEEHEPRTSTEPHPDFIKWKNELKQEILEDWERLMATIIEPNAQRSNGNEEESDGNLSCLLGKKGKLGVQNHLKKLEKKEKHFEAKLDQRLEKLDMKRKKVLEKAALRTANKNQTFDSTIGDLPFIMSGIATKDSLTLPKRVKVCTFFIHQWHIINDGTASWNDVWLKHFWSTPGLEPDEQLLKCNPLLPGQDCHVTIRFRTPKTLGTFNTFWHFVHGSEKTQFGHYVSLTGNTKLPKLTCGAGGQKKVQDIEEKQKDEMKTVRFDGEVNLLNQVDETEKEATCSNGKCLASTEIAAEMARNAAKALLKRTEKQTETNIEVESPKDSCDVSVDNVLETEVNVDENEESVPGFVLIDMPATNKTKPKDINQSVDSSEKIEEKEMNILQDLKVDGNMQTPPQTESSENDNIISNNKLFEKDTVISKRGIDKASYTEVPFPKILSCQQTSSQLPNTPHLNSTTKDSSGAERPAQTNLHVPPKCVYVLPQPTYGVSQGHPTTFPILTPQIPSTHVTAFPPPASFNCPNLPYATHKYKVPQFPNVMLPSTAVAYHQTSPLTVYSFPPPIPPENLLKYPTSAETKQNVISPTDNPTPQSHANTAHHFTTYGMSASPSTTSGMAAPLHTTNGMSAPFHTTNGMSEPLHTTNGMSATPETSNWMSAPLSTTNGMSVPSHTTNGMSAPPHTTNGMSATPQTANWMSAPLCTTNGMSAPCHTTNGMSATPHTTSGMTMPQPSNNVSTAPVTKVITSQPGMTQPVQILPQGLMDGAINVAAHAYSTACNALNTFRHKDGELQAFDPVFENNMILLMEMGFRNVERNARLLKRFNNDINQVIGLICTSPTGDNLEID